MIRRIALALALLAVAGACTPTRTTIRPPFEMDGKTYQTEPELRTEAARRCEDAGHARPEHDYTTDGCSVWPDGDWRACCIEHDVSYWCGGTSEQRKAADQKLRQCVRERSQAFNAHTMFFGVRLGGVRWLPFPWRWGYGHDWPFSPADEKERTD